MISQNCGQKEILEARNLTGKKDVSQKEVIQPKQKLRVRNDSKRLIISDFKIVSIQQIPLICGGYAPRTPVDA